MQRFTVPQFIDIEDKILGPVTVRQFIILLVCVLTAAIGYKLFDFELFLIWGILWVGGGAILAFIRINGMPFHYFIFRNLIVEIEKRS